MRKVAIVGFAPSTRDKAPYNNPEWEIWVLNEYKTILPNGGASNITKHFELHHRSTVLDSKRNKDYIDDLRSSTVPIYMTEKHDDIPMSVEYPLQDIIKALGTDYFTNSISYMIAMAVYEGVEELAIYGVDMAQEEEYAKERPSVEYFVGYARARGIPVFIPPESDICKVPYLYGFQEESASKICKTIDPKRADLVARLNNADYTVDEMLERTDYTLKKYIFEYLPTVNQIIELEKKLKELSTTLANAQTTDEKIMITNQITELSKTAPDVATTLFPMHDMLMQLWDFNQNVRGSKKERLFLAGAESICTHLRVQLCPFD
jgi:hypothetical protein